MSGIAVVGSLNLDMTVEVERLPTPGETVLGRSHFYDNGGKGANQAVAAARLGSTTSMHGRLGADAAGERLSRALAQDGVDVTRVGLDPHAATGVAMITVDGSGENTIVVSPGANAGFTPDLLDGTALAEAELVLLQLEIPLETVRAALQAARGMVILNPAPAAPLTKEDLALVDVLVPNRTELGRITGTPIAQTVRGIIEQVESLEVTTVVTLGAGGALLWSEGTARHFPALPVRAVDPTAAGDAFCGGMADALVRGFVIEEAVEWAVRCGAVTTTRWGAQGSLPTRSEVLAMESP